MPRHLKNSKRELRHCANRILDSLVNKANDRTTQESASKRKNCFKICLSPLENRKWQTLCRILTRFDCFAGFLIMQWSVTIPIQFPAVNEIALFVMLSYFVVLLCLFQPLHSTLLTQERFLLYFWEQCANCCNYNRKTAICDQKIFQTIQILCYLVAIFRFRLLNCCLPVEKRDIRGDREAQKILREGRRGERAMKAW